jgi:RNA polymerase sigma-B factor
VRVSRELPTRARFDTSTTESCGLGKLRAEANGELPLTLLKTAAGERHREDLAVASPPSRTRARAQERQSRAQLTDQILDELDVTTDQVRRKALLDELVCVNMGVAQSIAARYRGRGVADDDLEQVAYVALVRVAQSYDHASGHDFMSYAVPSIRGEVRRYFRDHGWMVRPPRRVQEMQGRISATESDLATELGRPPAPEELAATLDEPIEHVAEALAANGCFTPTSLDQTLGATRTSSLAERLGVPEEGLDAAEARVVLAPVVRRLGERDRKILMMRFFGDCTQQEIADQIGVTQMQVSRLLSNVLARLRDELDKGRPEQDDGSAGPVAHRPQHRTTDTVRRR